ncbi:hypothetical protein KIN20_035365 [Parelaphostrongylus tenuis]|uniref:Uncharacterized protein n=1 Tax=Parelaphostrongylus tenuis TaxID=148309 RepID=A0AAD5RBQ1_PARTN|nr:hypothetical protein KIN20_035365 [Parelaphostrongylus tenuis]
MAKTGSWPQFKRGAQIDAVLQDSALSHIAKPTRHILEEMSWATAPHPPICGNQWATTEYWTSSYNYYANLSDANRT